MNVFNQALSQTANNSQIEQTNRTPFIRHQSGTAFINFIHRKTQHLYQSNLSELLYSHSKNTLFIAEKPFIFFRNVCRINLLQKRFMFYQFTQTVDEYPFRSVYPKNAFYLYNGFYKNLILNLISPET